jgi:hypothetical protein
MRSIPTVPVPRQCRDCDFWVTAADRYCPNCGIRRPFVLGRLRAPAPAETPADAPVGFGRATGAVGGSLVSGGIGWLTGIALTAHFGWGMVGGAVPVELLTAILSMPLGGVAGWYVDQFNHFGRTVIVERGPEHLALFEWTIRQRLRELATRERLLRTVEAGVGDEERSVEWERVNEALVTARTALRRQRSAYRAKLCEVWLVRLQNTLSGAGAHVECLSDRQCGRRLDAVTMALDQAEAQFAEWHAEDEASASHPATRRLQDLVEVGNQLRQQLLAQRAVIVVRHAAALPTTLPPVEVPRPGPAPEHMLSARAELGEFSSAFRALEAENARLRAEEVVAREIGWE